MPNSPPLSNLLCFLRRTLHFHIKIAERSPAYTHRLPFCMQSHHSNPDALASLDRARLSLNLKELVGVVFPVGFCDRASDTSRAGFFLFGATRCFATGNPSLPCASYIVIAARLLIRLCGANLNRDAPFLRAMLR
jgi:hypothetical protein